MTTRTPRSLPPFYLGRNARDTRFYVVRRSNGERVSDEFSMPSEARREVEEWNEAEGFVTYPQGWRHYPGDTCRHGVYVGGCGADLMCGACESGDA